MEPVPRLQSALLALFIAVIALDACPAFFRTLDRAKSAIDPLVDVTGLWQGSWQLFAPDVDKVNSRVSAEILFSEHDGALEFAGLDQACPARSVHEVSRGGVLRQHSPGF